MIFIPFISVIILLRIGELILAKRNEKWLLQNGAVEYGKNHYPFIVAVHSLFFVSVIIEYLTQQTPSFSLLILLFYFVLLAFKVWIIASLGKFWNTKIYRIQNFPLIKKGPYKYFKHPNYIVVIAEIAAIPLIFHLYYTAVIFSLLNAIMLTVRIKEENVALQIPI
ncbi:MAG: isoprenylcysteine carboxylmethyltransferase family protein [Bacteroidota bacterium]|nr:isoprenylcysteine carboxylmethyltransferase family protein [Bacteroidota bacterium]